MNRFILIHNLGLILPFARTEAFPWRSLRFKCFFELFAILTDFVLLRFFRINDPYRLIGVLVVLVLLALPFFIDPVGVTLSELHSFVIGEALRHGKLMYIEVYDSTAPLAAAIFGAVDWLFGRSLTARHSLSLLLIFFQASFFAIVLMSASYLIGQLTAGQDVKIIKDLGLAATSIFGLFIAVFIGIGLVSKEVEKRSIYSLLSKPIERYQLVLGKYLGLVLTLAVNLSVMAVALYLVLAYMAWAAPAGAELGWERPALDPALLKALLLTFLELSIVTAIAVFFSTFSTPILSAALTFGLFVAGRFGADLRNFNQVIDSPVANGVTTAVYWMLPNRLSTSVAFARALVAPSARTLCT